MHARFIAKNVVFFREKTIVVQWNNNANQIQFHFVWVFKNEKKTLLESKQMVSVIKVGSIYVCMLV